MKALEWAARQQAFLGLVGLAVCGELGLTWAAAACGVLTLDVYLEQWRPRRAEQ